ncbi:hypothetical protein J5751_05395 [bacterium]|nr:hypothetical protein [bacterium]
MVVEEGTEYSGVEIVKKEVDNEYESSEGNDVLYETNVTAKQVEENENLHEV